VSSAYNQCMKRSLVFVLLLAGCATTPYENYQSEIKASHDAATREPGAHPVTNDMLAHMDTFSVQICGIDKPKEKWTKSEVDSCSEKFNRAFYARLDELYFMGDPKKVWVKCEAHPVECARYENIEEWAAESHNANVEASRTQKLSALEMWKEGRENQEALQKSLALQRIGNAFQQQFRQPAKNCTTTPLPLGGFTTRCD
jgi:hypothetical protein